MKIQIPYGKGFLTCPIVPDGVIYSKIDELQVEKPGVELVREAMASPIGSKRLEELAEGKKNAVIIISDHTRPVPSRDIIPLMLVALRKGNPKIDITLLVATGLHRFTEKKELVEKLGEEIVSKERIVVHDAFSPEQNVSIGVLPSGAELVVDRLAVETELLVAEGFIEPHFFAGFSGGRKSVLPGVCEKTTVLGNHCGRFIDSPRARTGILEGNPIHEDMIAAGQMAKLAFIVNVVINEEKKTVAAFAGDFEKAHLAGVEFLRPYCQVKPIPGDIVITSNGGAPLDQNVYQCVKSLTAGEATAKEGAVLIICAEVADGVGGDGFYRTLSECSSPKETYEIFVNTPQDQTLPDQWQSQIMLRILKKHKVIFVSPPQMAKTLREMKLEWCATLEEAIELARSMQGKDGKITVIPNGISVMIEQ